MVERYNSPQYIQDARLVIAALSDSGPTRSVNEDSIAVCGTNRDDPHREMLLVVADGLGGHKAGEIASTMVTELFPEFFFTNASTNRLEAMREALRATNRAMLNTASTTSSYSGMGSTVVAGLITRQYFITANVGDSRAYVFRNGATLLKTTDDSFAHALPGIQGRQNLSHVLTQALGVQHHITPHLHILRLEPGDLILLCTDGITDVLSDGEISAIVHGQDSTTCARELVAAATANGSTDNMTVIIGRILSLATPEETTHLRVGAPDNSPT